MEHSVLDVRKIANSRAGDDIHFRGLKIVCEALRPLRCPVQLSWEVFFLSYDGQNSILCPCRSFAMPQTQFSMRSYHLRNWQPLYVSQIQKSKARPTMRMLILLSDWQQELQENANLPIQEPKWYRKSGLSYTILYNYHSKGCHWALLMTVCKVTLSTFTPIYYGIQ